MKSIAHPPLSPRALLIIGLVVLGLAIAVGTYWGIHAFNVDVNRYQCYALTFWQGSSAEHLLPAGQCSFLHISTATQPPLHILPLEYPPLTLVLFSLPLLAPLPYYQPIFTILMVLMAVLIYWLLLHHGPRGAALAFALYMLIGVLGTVTGRFDLVPAALTLLCLIAAERKHWTFSYVALAFGFLLKIYPILLLPALFIAEQQDAQCLYIPPKSLTFKSFPEALWCSLRDIQHWRWKNTLIFFSILLGVTGFFAAFNFQGAIVSQLSYFVNRPIQIEATGTTLLWLGTLFGFPVHIELSYGSVNMVSALGGAVALLFEVLFVLGYLYTLLLQWRGKLDLVQACIAILLVFIVTGKVFSPQYLIWIIPLLAYGGAYDSLWLVAWGTISLLSTFIYPFLNTRTHDTLRVPYVPGFIEFVAARNAAFVLLTLAYLLNWFYIRQRKALPSDIMSKETRPLNTI